MKKSKKITPATRRKIKSALLAEVPTRIRRLRAKMRANKLDAIFLTDNIALRYFTGFNGHDSAVLVTKGGGKSGVALLTDFRLFEEASLNAPHATVILRSSSLEQTALKFAKEKKCRNIGFDEGQISLQAFKRLEKTATELKGAKIKLIPNNNILSSLYMKKSPAEVDAIRAAVGIAQIAQEVARIAFLDGGSEIDIARSLDRTCEDLGAEGPGFATIVAYDKRTTLNHAVPTDVRPKKNSFMLTDWGATFEGYRSDLTRVFAPHKIPNWLSELHELVLAANKAAVKIIHHGVTLHDIDAAAREVFREAGMEKYFGHGLGHSFGLRIHESPFISRGAKAKIEAGTVVTVEPGLYIKGRGGVRIEDDLLVTKDGAELLSSYPRELS